MRFRIACSLLALVIVACGQTTKAVSTPTATLPSQELITTRPAVSTANAPTSLLPSVTPGITNSVQEQCPTFSPEFITPMLATRAGWCEIENHNVRIAYPNDWAVGAMGAAAQNRQFQRQTASGEKQIIGVIFSTTDLPIEQADQAVSSGYELSNPQPFVDPHETTITKSLQTIANRKVLVLTTEWETISIRRYFWLDQETLLIFEVRAPISNFDSVEYKTLFSALEEVMSAVQVVGLPPKG